MAASTMSLTSDALRITTGGLGAGGAPTSAETAFPGERTNSWAMSTDYSPRHRRNLMWERFTPVLLPRVTPAVTRKLRHRGWHEGAGHATGNPVGPAKRPSVTRPGWCPVADDTSTRAGEHGADTVAEGEPDYRFTLANERTFLAWHRTALGLLAVMTAIAQLSHGAPANTPASASAVMRSLAAS